MDSNINNMVISYPHTTNSTNTLPKSNTTVNSINSNDIVNSAISISKDTSINWGDAKMDADCASAIMNTWRYNSWTGNMAYSTKEKEGKNMSIFENMEFGPCGDRVKISPIGIAIKNNNDEWVSYNVETNEIVNVDLINFGNLNLVYKIPVALSEISTGDAILHNKHVMFVTKVKKNSLIVIDVTDGESKQILPTKSYFGYNYIIKITSLIDMDNINASEEAPFGNLIPYMLFSGQNNDINPLIFLLMKDKDFNFDIKNPMLLMILSQSTNMKDILPFLFL